jgi:hypothetical protein
MIRLDIHICRDWVNELLRSASRCPDRALEHYPIGSCKTQLAASRIDGFKIIVGLGKGGVTFPDGMTMLYIAELASKYRLHSGDAGLDQFNNSSCRVL